MTTPDLETALSTALADRQLLTHPFYRRWEAGEVTMTELAEYAGQYRHFEAALPAFLASLAEALDEGPARTMVLDNLADELGDPVPHLELFDRFARAVDAATVDPSPATENLLGTYRDLLEQGPGAALAGFLAYERQSSAVARSKTEGLLRHYGLDADGVAFWAHHGDVDERHGQWMGAALASLAAPASRVPGGAGTMVAAVDGGVGDVGEIGDGSEVDPATVVAELVSAARRGADAWWGFLDERQEGAAVHCA